MALFVICWWGSSSEDLRRKEYRFIGITPNSIQAWRDNTCYGHLRPPASHTKTIQVRRTRHAGPPHIA